VKALWLSTSCFLLCKPFKFAVSKSLFGVTNFALGRFRQNGLLPSILFIVCVAMSPQGLVAAPVKHDVRIVVDISGSMKKSDPNNLRRPAVNLLAQMLPENAQAGVWTFGRFVNMLVPIRKVDPSWRTDVKNKSQQINSIALFTNIPEALERVSVGWSTPDETVRRSVIFLTDGKVDISKDPLVNAKARQEVMSRLIPKLRQTGAQIHTIALSEDVDVELLKALSYQTNGQFQIALTEDDLVRVFVSAFDASIPQQEVPLGQDNAFDIDQEVQEFTVLVYKRPGAKPAALIRPDDLKLSLAKHGDDVRWYMDDALEVVTVSNPKAGRWQLQAEIDPGNRVTVLSDLSLNISEVPHHLFAGESLTIKAFFEDANGIVINREFLSLLDLEFVQKLVDGNKTWEGKLTSFSNNQIKIPKDGKYEARLKKSLLPGEHEITLIATGRTFQRKITRTFSVVERVVEASLMPPIDVSDQFTIFVKPIASYVDTSLMIRAKVQGPNQQVRDLKLTLDEHAGWQARFDAYDGPGTYKVIMLVTGQSLNGSEIRNEVGPLEASTPSSFGEFGSSILEEETDNPFAEMTKSEPVVEDTEAQSSYDDEFEEESFEEEETDEEEGLPKEEEFIEEPDDPEAVADETQERQDAEEEGILSSGLGIAMVIMFILFNIALIGFGYWFYHGASKRKAQQDAEDDERLAQISSAELMEDDSEEEDENTSGLPEGMPEAPQLDLDDDDEEEPPFDPDRIA